MKEHPITPPPELILEWCRGWNCTAELTALKQVATQAARWGADQELEACVGWLNPRWAAELQEARRPKPPSLKEQALQALAAAALRAAADQVVPEEPLYYGDQRWQFERDTRQRCRQQLLAIADELEAQ